MTFRLADDLDRIGLAQGPPGAAGFAAVQTAHMRAIPLENVDPLLGRMPGRGACTERRDRPRAGAPSRGKPPLR